MTKRFQSIPLIYLLLLLLPLIVVEVLYKIYFYYRFVLIIDLKQYSFPIFAVDSFLKYFSFPFVFVRFRRNLSQNTFFITIRNESCLTENQTTKQFYFSLFVASIAINENLFRYKYIDHELH